MNVSFREFSLPFCEQKRQQLISVKKLRTIITEMGIKVNCILVTKLGRFNNWVPCVSSSRNVQDTTKQTLLDDVDVGNHRDTIGNGSLRSGSPFNHTREQRGAKRSSGKESGEEAPRQWLPRRRLISPTLLRTSAWYDRRLRSIMGNKRAHQDRATGLSGTPQTVRQNCWCHERTPHTPISYELLAIPTSPREDKNMPSWSFAGQQ